MRLPGEDHVQKGLEIRRYMRSRRGGLSHVSRKPSFDLLDCTCRCGARVEPLLYSSGAAAVGVTVAHVRTKLRYDRISHGSVCKLQLADHLGHLFRCRCSQEAYNLSQQALIPLGELTAGILWSRGDVSVRFPVGQACGGELGAIGVCGDQATPLLQLSVLSRISVHTGRRECRMVFEDSGAPIRGVSSCSPCMFMCANAFIAGTRSEHLRLQQILRARRYLHSLAANTTLQARAHSGGMLPCSKSPTPLLAAAVAASPSQGHDREAQEQ